MKRFSRWIDIDSIAHALKNYRHKPVRLGIVEFGCKPKIHGTNGGIYIDKTGWALQSRNSQLSEGQDNFGFYNYFKDVFSTTSIFDGLSAHLKGEEKLVVHGEWAGPNIIKGTSASYIGHRVFFIFSIEFIDSEGNSSFLVDPEAITKILPQEMLSRSDIRVLPWYPLTIKFNLDTYEGTDKAIQAISTEIDIFEVQDPYINLMFNVEGCGEGLVFYPMLGNLLTSTQMELVFKCKTKAHTVNKTVSNKLGPHVEKIADILEFVQLFVTDARIQQALNENQIQALSKRDFSVLIPWVLEDIKKESAHELEESGLIWKAVSGPCGGAARAKFESLMLPPSGVSSPTH